MGSIFPYLITKSQRSESPNIFLEKNGQHFPLFGHEITEIEKPQNFPGEESSEWEHFSVFDHEIKEIEKPPNFLGEKWAAFSPV